MSGPSRLVSATICTLDVLQIAEAIAAIGLAAIGLAADAWQKAIYSTTQSVRRCRGCVGQSTVNWLATQAAQLSLPGLAFVHIPIPEFVTAWNAGLVRGSKAEPVNCPSAKGSLFEALLQANVTAVFSGHDHDNNFDAVHPHGIRLVYGHKTGKPVLHAQS